MTLSPRVGGATSKPTDVSPTPAGQRYASNTCVTTKMTYEFFNELIDIFLQAQTAYGVTNVANDIQSLKKILDALRTGGFDFTVGTVNLRGNYRITSPETVNIVLDDDNNQPDRSFNVYINSQADSNAVFGVNESGAMQLFGRIETVFNMFDVASTNLEATGVISCARVDTVGGSPTQLWYIGKPSTDNENVLLRCLTNGALILSSNADVNVQLDQNNNGTNSFNVLNGAGGNCFNVQEDGTTNTTLFTAVTATITTANIINAGITTANIATSNTTTENATNLNVSGTMTAQGKTVRAFTRASCEVNAGGTIVEQKGVASVTKTGTGVYRVVISESAPSPYFVQATAGSGGADCTKINATTTDVRTYNTSPSLMDAPFLFEVFY